jgi:hypothetical protein
MLDPSHKSHKSHKKGMAIAGSKARQVFFT